MDHKQKIKNFLFSHLKRNFENIKWSSIPNFNVKFMPFIYAIWEKVFLKDFVLDGIDFLIEADADLRLQLSWEEKFKYEWRYLGSKSLTI